MQLATEFASVDLLSRCNGTWWVAQTVSQQECRLVADLQHVGATPIYLTETVEKTYERADGYTRRQTYDRALFPGYVFFNGDAPPASVPDPRGKHWDAAKENPVTLAVIEVKNQRRLRDELRDFLIFYEQSGGRVTAQRIEPGCMVRIVNGPFRGIAAWRVDRIDGGKVYMPINVLGRMVETCVSEKDVEPVEAN